MILVTGATGLVGRSVCECLAAKAVPLRAISRTQRRGHVAVGHIDADTDWTQALQDVDVVVHLAARVHVMNETVADPAEAFREANVRATLNLARQASRAGVRRLVYISSIKVNGERTTPGAAFSADDQPAPSDAYGVSKHESEEALLALAASDGLEVTIIRPPLVYGPGVRANFEALLKLVDRRIPLPFANIDNKRSFIFSGNLADFIALCCQHPGAANEIFTVSDGDDLSTTRLLRLIGDALQRPVRLFSVPVGVMQTAARLLGKASFADRLFGWLQVDVSKAQHKLGWQPPFSVSAGLEATARAFKAARH